LGEAEGEMPSASPTRDLGTRLSLHTPILQVSVFRLFLLVLFPDLHV